MSGLEVLPITCLRKKLNPKNRRRVLVALWECEKGIEERFYDRALSQF